MFRGEASTPLLRALEARSWTARDLAAQLGVHETTVGRWLARPDSMTTLNREAVRALLGAEAC